MTKKLGFMTETLNNKNYIFKKVFDNSFFSYFNKRISRLSFVLYILYITTKHIQGLTIFFEMENTQNNN